MDHRLLDEPWLDDGDAGDDYVCDGCHTLEHGSLLFHHKGQWLCAQCKDAADQVDADDASHDHVA